MKLFLMIQYGRKLHLKFQSFKIIDINIIKNVKQALGLALVAHPEDVKDQKKDVSDISWTSNSDSQPSA